MQKLKVLMVPAAGTPTLKDIDGSLESMQKLVGGYIETDAICPGILAVVNEEGIVSDLPVNLGIAGRLYFGDVFLVGHDPGDEDFRSIGFYEAVNLFEQGIVPGYGVNLA